MVAPVTTTLPRTELQLVSGRPRGVGSAADSLGEFDSGDGAGGGVTRVEDLAVRHVIDDVRREREQVGIVLSR